MTKKERAFHINYYTSKINYYKLMIRFPERIKAAIRMIKTCRQWIRYFEEVK